MPTGVEYHRALLRLHAALAQWHQADQRLERCSTRDRDRAAVLVAQLNATEELHAAYSAVAQQILAEIEAVWSKGVSDAS